jgi:hypothetical protein
VDESSRSIEIFFTDDFDDVGNHGGIHEKGDRQLFRILHVKLSLGGDHFPVRDVMEHNPQHEFVEEDDNQWHAKRNPLSSIETVFVHVAFLQFIVGFFDVVTLELDDTPDNHKTTKHHYATHRIGFNYTFELLWGRHMDEFPVYFIGLWGRVDVELITIPG